MTNSQQIKQLQQLQQNNLPGADLSADDLAAAGLANTDLHCGFVAIVGRPNVGKSTLLNKLIGEKISITANKPQTTRHKILGIRTMDQYQAVYIDTPGIHSYEKKALNKYMNKVAKAAMRDVDVIMFVVEAGKWTTEDQLVLDLLKSKISNGTTAILAINKVDLLADKDQLLPFIAKINQQQAFTAIIPLSAKTGVQVAELQQAVMQNLSNGPHFYAADTVTDQRLQFRIAEIIREKLTRFLGKELPYASTIEIERIEDTPEQKVIHALIWVERDSQKQIVIGKGGSKLKTIGSEARLALNDLLKCRTHLQLWVKVRSGWSDNNKNLLSLGYT